MATMKLSKTQEAVLAEVCEWPGTRFAHSTKRRFAAAQWLGGKGLIEWRDWNLTNNCPSGWYPTVDAEQPIDKLQ